MERITEKDKTEMSLGITNAAHEIYSEVLMSSVMARQITLLIHILLLVFFHLSDHDQFQAINFLEKNNPLKRARKGISLGVAFHSGHFHHCAILAFLPILASLIISANWVAFLAILAISAVSAFSAKYAV